MNCSLPGSSVHGILQARILGWVAFPFSRGSSQPRDQTQVSRIAGGLFTVWATREARKEAWYKWIKSLDEYEIKWKVKVKSLSRVRLFVTPKTVAYQASPSMGFSRQEYWSGLPFPSPGDLPNPGIKPGSSSLEADALTSEPPRKPQKLSGLMSKWPHSQLLLSPHLDVISSFWNLVSLS